MFVADPQIIDPHSYPGRPWPLNPLTVKITDNYLRRSYASLQTYLHPDTLFFLGDLFDGGREWKTARGNSDDPEWARGHRPAGEQKHLKQWRKKYGEGFWLREYARFGDIFFDSWNLGGAYGGEWQRGRKLIASLPGNHDLGFGAEVKVPVRHRFNTYFGEPNRVDVIGNHTFVSVDTVSLSADTSEMKDQVDLRGIYSPVQEFLGEVQSTKRKAVARELRFWRGETEELQYEHKVENLDTADLAHLPTLNRGDEAPEFPTILLSHVPLYRDRGTPCGPMREHWPPSKPPKGQDTPVMPDHRNAIRLGAGYQYQNTLSDEDSSKLVQSVGNVVHAFSGDDHDYCEIVHSERNGRVPEITVKSMSMAMGVSTPGFQMVSLYNPVAAADGTPVPDSPSPTLQTHLCLLPSALSIYTTYAVFAVLSVLLLIARAFLVPVLGLQPFALDSTPLRDDYTYSSSSSVLPTFVKAKQEADDYNDAADADGDGGPPPAAYDGPTWLGASGSKPLSRVAAGSTSMTTTTRTRGPSLSSGLVAQARNADQAKPPKPFKPPPEATRHPNHHHHHHHHHHQHDRSPGNRWAWGSSQSRGPRIEIRRDPYGGLGGRGLWMAASSRSRAGMLHKGTVFGREAWTSCWRVVWMVGTLWAWFVWRG